VPIYRIRCTICDQEDDVFRSIAERDSLEPCRRCQSPVERVIVPQSVVPDIEPYQSMIDGSMITSRSHHRAHLKANNCVEMGNDWQSAIPKKRDMYIPEASKQRRREFLAHQVDSKLRKR